MAVRAAGSVLCAPYDEDDELAMVSFVTAKGKLADFLVWEEQTCFKDLDENEYGS